MLFHEELVFLSQYKTEGKNLLIRCKKRDLFLDFLPILLVSLVSFPLAERQKIRINHVLRCASVCFAQLCAA
jgi:hypothetical protein